MKTLHIIDHLGLGGAQTILKSVFESQKENPDIYCYSLRTNKDGHLNIEHKNAYCHKGTKRLSFSALSELKKLIKENKIDVLHCHLKKGLAVGWLMKKLFFRNIKLIFHEHSDIYKGDSVYNFMLKFTRKDIDLYVSVSEAIKQRMIKKAGIKAGKIQIVRNFADTHKFSRENVDINEADSIKSRLNLDNADLVIGFFGRFTHQKNCEVLIKALPFVDHANFKVLIVGGGENKQKLLNLADELKISEKVTFIDYQKDIRNLLSLCDICVLPSRWEGSPMIYYEAAAMGIPVIGSDTDGINETIRHGVNGLLFKSNDPKDLADKINSYQTTPNLKVTIKNNLKEGIKDCGVKGYVKKLEGLNR